MANPLEVIMKWAMDNVFILAILGIAIYFFHGYFNLKKVEKINSVNRSEVERKNIIERLKLNPSKKYKWLYKGSELIGKISHLIETKVPHNPEPFEVITMVVKPMLLAKPIRITNPFAKSKVIEVEKSKQVIVWEEDGSMTPKESNKLRINGEIAITQYQGIYYTIGKNEDLMIDNIRNFDTFKTDINNLASIYFVKSQEQSTYAPQYAHELALKEKEIQLEMAKKKGKMETI